MAIAAPQERDLGERVRATIGIFITLAGVSCGLTMLYMGMRSVMAVGGFCAEGGAFVIEQHCPQGVVGLVFGGIWGGIIFYGLYIWQLVSHKVPGFALLGWSALFLSLGWNFLEFGLNPPGPPDQGLAWGWLVCAILFGLMGGLPLLAVAKPTYDGFFGDKPEQPTGGMLSGTLSATASMIRRTPPTTSAEPPYSPPTTATEYHMTSPEAANPDLVDELERLTAMHESGALTDAEFESAKRKVISGDS